MAMNLFDRIERKKRMERLKSALLIFAGCVAALFTFWYVVDTISKAIGVNHG